jgi:hypothetical protein
MANPEDDQRCLFCTRDLKDLGRAKEHIIPMWLQKEWGLSDKLLEPTHFDKQGNVVSSRRHRVSGLLAGHVCRRCNNGWMSDLEMAARPLILDLAEGRRKIRSLDNSEALLLARWTIKTCYALHAGSNYRKIVPNDRPPTILAENYRLPAGVFVVGHAYQKGQDFSWSQAQVWPLLILEGGSTEIEKHLVRLSYKIALRLGGLYLMVFYIPTSHSRAVLRFGKHIPLYPRWSHPVCWDKKDKGWPSDTTKRLYQFVFSVGVAVDRTGRWEELSR